MKAYSSSVNRTPTGLEETKEEIDERLLQESELKTWLNLPKTKELLTFLAERELKLLNNARNQSKVAENIISVNKPLHISIGYREVIEYIITNNKPKE